MAVGALFFHLALAGLAADLGGVPGGGRPGDGGQLRDPLPGGADRLLADGRRRGDAARRAGGDVLLRDAAAADPLPRPARRRVARALPWASLLQVPADVFLGRVHGTGVLAGLGFQAALGGRCCWSPAGCSSRRRPAGWWSRVADTADAARSRSDGSWQDAAWPRESAAARLRDGLRAYGLIAGMWVRSSMAYRLSFVVMAVEQRRDHRTGLRRDRAHVRHTRALGGFDLAADRLPVRDVGRLAGPGRPAAGQHGPARAAGARRHDGHPAGAAGAGASCRWPPTASRCAGSAGSARRLLVLAWSLTRLDLDWTPLKVAAACR